MKALEKTPRKRQKLKQWGNILRVLKAKPEEKSLLIYIPKKAISEKEALEKQEKKRAAWRRKYQRAKNKNPERFRARSRRWALANPEKTKATAKRSALKNPEKHKAISIQKTQARRARKYQNSTTQQISEASAKTKELKLSGFASCPYCKMFYLAESMHIDHIMPLSRGGSHSAENITLACCQCNQAKGSKTINHGGITANHASA